MSNVDEKDCKSIITENLEKQLDEEYLKVKKYPATHIRKYHSIIKDIKEMGYKDVLRNSEGRHKII